MTMESLIGQQMWVAQVLRPKLENETDSEGKIIDDFVVVFPKVRGRMVLNSSHQQAMWATQGIQAQYTFLTFESRIEVGWYVNILPVRITTETLVDVRRYEVTSIGERKMGMGTLNSYCRYQLTQTIATRPQQGSSEPQ